MQVNCYNRLMYYIDRTPLFYRNATKLIKKNWLLRGKTEATISLLSQNPFDQKLRTHKVKNTKFGAAWSSQVTSDIRIIWEFQEEAIIVLLTIGGHSRKRNVCS